MNQSVPRLKTSDSMNTALELLINHPFICIESEDGVFEGILPRSTVLNQLSKHIKTLNKKMD